MSEDNLPAEIQITDLSDQDLKIVAKYEAEGCPDLASVDEQKLYRMMDMYLSGSTYWQIQNALAIKRPLVLYMSHRYQWYKAKREYLNEMQEKIKGRVIDSKLVSQDFLLLLNQAWQKKISRKLQRYLATDNDEHTADIDLKEVSQLLKTIEMINNLGADGKDSKGRTPAVGLNVGDGVTIKNNGDNSVTITPKEKTIGEIMKQFADTRRAEELKAAKPEKKRDIKKNEGETDE